MDSPLKFRKEEILFGCFQLNPSSLTFPSKPPSEDCLYLNVFVPDLLVKVRSLRDEQVNTFPLIQRRKARACGVK